MDATYRLIAFRARGEHLQEIFAGASAFKSFRGRHPEKDDTEV